MKPCLLVIDMQNDFLSRWEASERTRLLANTNDLISAFRQRNLDVIWIFQSFKPDLSDAFLEMRDHNILNTIQGTPGVRIADSLNVQASDTRIEKKRYSGFFGTTLDDELSRISPDVIVMAGVNTHACIRMTAIDAYQRDYRVILAADCIGSLQTEHAEISLTYMKDKIARVLTNSEIQALIE